MFTHTHTYTCISGSLSSVIMMISVLILALFVSRIEASTQEISSPFSFGSRSILRSVNDANKNGAEKPDYAVDLNATNFDSVLKETPTTYAIVEFFANWCPACRNYKPHYEKVARLFNGAGAVYPGIILMARVDCASKKFRSCGVIHHGWGTSKKEMHFQDTGNAPMIPPHAFYSLEINTNLCDKFSVGHYPMLLWGPPSKFVSGSWDPKQENSEIRSIDDGRTADRLLNWINKQMGSSYGLDDKKFENEHLHTNISDPGQIARAVYDVEEATSTAFDIILGQKMIKSETRASLVKFLQLLVVHHPSRRCRKGTAEILVDFDDLSANKEEVAGLSQEGVLGNYQICGKEIPRGYWMFCRGSKNETRGFSCGLWVLLHSLSVRVDDGESHMAFTAVCDFIHSFFICEECRQHFYDMCSSVSTPFKRSREFVLWLWNAHNKVNERLMKEEASLGTGDPKFPKVIWPPKQLCPSCYRSQNSKDNHIDWDHDEVFNFLSNYYGKMLISLYKDKERLRDGQTGGVVVEDLAVSTNAVVVPVGAALAIAVASCAFGALACYWRQQQKSRKYKYHLHSLKNI